MRWMKIKKAIIFLLIALMVLGCIPVSYGKEQSDIIYIDTKEALLEFAKQCKLDTWSKGKVIELTADIDLGGEVFSPIPIFSGTFDGKGHTISGIQIEDAGSTQGFFRYIEADGIVKDVTFKGNVSPSGTRSVVGGVAGSNAGKIQNVVFHGTVSGHDNIGGLVGTNVETGQIVMSTTEGEVVGEKMVGGIVGKNLGTIIGVTNVGKINTVVNENTGTTEVIDLELEGRLEQLGGFSNVDNSQQLLDRYTDIGGVAGYSSGMIQGAINKGEVGYPHVGYNVGGIVGRQNGYMLGVVNEGTVYGRKDVGGIVGHAEPNISLNVAEDILDRLDKELETLRRLVNTTLNEMDHTTEETAHYLSSVSEYASVAKGHTQTLFNETTEFVDDNVAQINQISAIIAQVVDQIIPVMESMEASAEHITRGIDDLERAFEELEEATDASEEVSSHMEKAIKDLRYANDSVHNAILAIQRSMKDFKEAVVVEDERGVEIALEQLSLSISELSRESQRLASGFESLRFILESLTSVEDLMNQQGVIIAQLKELILSFERMSGLFIGISGNITEISANTHMDWGSMQDGIQELEWMMVDLEEVSEHVDDAFGHMIDGFEPMEEMTDAVGKAMNRVARAMAHMSDGTEEITSGIGKVADIVIDLSEEEPIVFSDLGDDYRVVSDELYSSIDQIAAELEGLNTSATDNSEKLTQQMSQINNQFNVIMGVLLEAVEEVIHFDENMNPINRIEDFSAETIEETTLGKILESTNKGTVEADHNVGGIVGLVGIEYGINQELDLGTPDSLNYTYQTRAVIQGCKNEGEIIGKKDYIGGIAGRMYTGIVIDSENYGTVKSTNGDYVGGIAGGSEALIHSSFSKNVIEGRNYVGGIVGLGKNIANNYSIVQILSGEENVGAIAGAVVEEEAYVQGNYFMNEVVGGIDQISYASQAEPASYEELLTHSEMPERFLGFNVTAVIDETTEIQIPVAFGEKTENITLPQLPEKEGYYSYWESLEIGEIVSDTRVEAVYKPWVTMIGSETTGENKLSFALAEGKFKDDVTIEVIERTDLPWIEEREGAPLASYQIRLENTQLGKEEEVPIRLLNEQNATLWTYKNNNWEVVEAEIVGKYSVTAIEGTEGIFYLEPQEESPILKVVGGLFGVGVVLGTANKVRKKFKKQDKEDTQVVV